MLDPTGRVVLVSGANRGIGRAIATTLHARGYRVSAGARELDGLAERLGIDDDDERLLCARYDAADRASHGAWVEATLERFGRIDALVNNAGTSNDFGIEHGEERELDALWSVNVKGPLFMVRACLPHLRASGHGRVVNVGSLSGKRVANDHVAYSMSKFAITALTHGIRRIAWDDGVRASVLCPGFVATDLTRHVSSVEREDMIDPDDLAELAATAIALPNNASVAELLVNCRYEATL